jgi:hypothetical protein
MQYYEYQLERKCENGWEFVRFVKHKHHPCCSVYERVVEV